ncbi:hypothetical protein HHK36_003485 [Tetracentron sinense]|uniref:Uncharacterized protein n=1 Tax=Tetracentron sinense TaxID=13715 RepID=A0A834ZTH7_TETSI|nr:hypothetical protein HHK36_003485 [Tetracentron sinense]
MSLPNAQEGDDQFYKEVDDEDEICISIETSIKESDTRVPHNKEPPVSMMDKERQISVDPVSLKQSTKTEELIPSKETRTAKPRFVSSSLPGSATSSPRLGSSLMRNYLKKWRNESQASPLPAVISLARQHSAALSHFALQRESHLRRSKSCGEGRACTPSDEFDIWSRHVNDLEHGDDDSFYESEAGEAGRNKSNKELADRHEDQGFKCGALCLFLPGFGKGKPVRARKDEGDAVLGNVVSRTVSLEKFECGSWSSSAIINDGTTEEGDQSMHLYFDLPLELIRNGVNDAHSPVTAAFVFDRDPKGVLKNSASRSAARKSHESSRHVRFSVSTPMSHPASPSSCITPRLRKAREDFNAYLEAQSA